MPTSTQATHAPEPWYFTPYRNSTREGQIEPAGGTDCIIADVPNADGKRAVACVNAMAGIKDPEAFIRAVRCLVANAEAQPDARMQGLTDCFAATLDDMEAVRSHLG